MSEFKVNVVFSNFFLKILHCPPLPSSLLCLECPDIYFWTCIPYVQKIMQQKKTMKVTHIKG